RSKHGRAAARSRGPGRDGRSPGRGPVQGDQGRRQVHQQVGADAGLGREPRRRADHEARALPASPLRVRRPAMTRTMTNSARRFWSAACAGLILGASADALAELRQFEMTIEEVELEVAPGFKARVWAYNGQVPGPLLRVNEGDEVEVTVHNFTTLNHTIHWHGIYLTNTWKHDGVPDVTQKGIEPGESFTNRFVADRIGRDRKSTR